MPKLKIVGDIMYEGAMHFSKQCRKPSELNDTELNNYVLATIHRAETTDNIENIKSVVEALNTINESKPVIMPVHPRTHSIIKGK